MLENSSNTPSRRLGITGLVILIILIAFNGYLIPWQKRVYGDTTPEMIQKTETGFEFFNVHFDVTLYPNYNAPFRYFLDHLKYNISDRFEEDTLSWLVVFFPFLISTFLSHFIFLKLTKRMYLGFLLWLFYTFSTFTLFTSSIHTNIITSINLLLFYSYVFYLFLNSNSKFKRLALLFLGTSVLIFALILELRMVIIIGPFFAGLFLYLISESSKSNKVSWKIISAYLGFGLSVSILCFSFLFSNLGLILGQASELTSRSTWGNAYFNIVNTISISHPFWNNSEPFNFVYNFPSIVSVSNIFLLGFIIWICFFLAKKNRGILIFLSLLLIFLFLSKQNNPPFPNVYDLIYRYPYFNLSREASKYFYGYLLSLCFLTIVALAQVKLKRKHITILALLILIPTFNNIYVFASGKYGRTTREYKSDASVYEEINKTLAPQGFVRVLWLPYKPGTQYNFENIEHLSFSSILNSYPLNNVRKESRNYTFEALRDVNFINYLSLMSVDYYILPNISNEPDMTNEINILYPNFSFDEFSDYVNSQLGGTKVGEIKNYEIYRFNRSPVLSLVKSGVNQLYLRSGQVSIKDSVVPEQMNIISDFLIRKGNCNNNPENNLDFKPTERITTKNESGVFEIDAFARVQEVPCVFLEWNNSTNYSYLFIKEYSGTPIEMISFTEEDEILSIYKLTDQSTGLVPVVCAEFCKVGLYLYGNKNAGNDYYYLTGNLVGSEVEYVQPETSKVFYLDRKIHSLKKDSMIDGEFISKDYDFVMLPYIFDRNYRLIVNDSELVPVENNHKMLLFNVSGFKNSIIKNIDLTYLPEKKIVNSLIISRYSTLILFGITILSSIIYAIYALINKLYASK